MERSGSFVYKGDSDTSEQEKGEKGVPPSSSGSRKGMEGRVVRGTRAPDIPIFERKNWLIHLLYIRKDFDACKILAKELLAETDELCEYAIYILGLVSRQEGDLHVSLELFQKAVLLNPNNPANVKQVARSWFLLGRHKVALSTYAEASLLNPSDWEVLHNQGVCSIYVKDYDKAVEYFQKALAQSPQTITYKQLGRVYMMTGSLDNALDIYKKAVEWDPEDSELLTTLGLLYLQNGDSQRSFEALGSAMVFDPYRGVAILAAGSMMQEHGDFDVALSKYRVAASTMPESPYLWNNIAMCNFGKKKFVAAISCLKRATYLAPFEWRILYNLGLIHLTTQQYASAFHFLRAATSYKPRSGHLYMLLAIALTRLDDLQNATLMYEESTKLSKDDPLIHLNYAVFLFNMDERSKSSHQLKLYNATLRNHKADHTHSEMAELANKMAPILNLGEELSLPKDPLPPNKVAKDPTPLDNSAPSESSTDVPEPGGLGEKKQSGLGTEKESGGLGLGLGLGEVDDASMKDRKLSYFDKTTPYL